MSRFRHLEFEDHERHDEQTALPLRDAAHFQEQAERYWLAGDYEIALRHYSRCLELDSGWFEGWAGQVRMLLELEEHKEADLWAQKALDLFPDHPELLALRAVALRRQGKRRQATECSDRSLTAEPITPWVWLARAEVFLDRRAAVVEGCISKAVALAREGRAVIQLEGARLLRRRGSLATALNLLQAALRELSDSALFWYEMGCCQQRLGLSTAAESLQQALRLHPGWALAEQALQRRGGWRGWFRR